MIILERENLLQQYVSFHKAVIAGKWRNINTTDIKITIDPVEFCNFKNYTNDWYDQITTYCKIYNKIPLKLKYEDDLMNLNTDSITLKTKINEWISLVGIDILESNYIPSRVTRQDFSKPSDSIINWEDINDKL